MKLFLQIDPCCGILCVCKKDTKALCCEISIRIFYYIKKV